jgi:hypothetical protein
MILRRIIAHFRKQEWTAIGIDFVIVVIGVLVATEASNWNAARITRQQGAEFSERLVADLREEAWGYQYYIEYYGDVLTSGQRALAILEGRTSGSDEALLIAAYRATQYRQNVRRRATYNELTSTGAIGLVEDEALRDTATRVYTSVMMDDIASAAIMSPYRARFRMVVPMEAQEALDRSCGDRVVAIGDYDGLPNSLDYECSLDLALAFVRRRAG